MKKILWILAPTLLLTLALFITAIAPKRYVDFSTTVIIAHLLSLAYIVVFVKRKWGDVVLLPLGFAVSPLFMAAYEYCNGGMFQHMFTILTMCIYSFPLVLLTTGILIVKRIPPR